MNNRYRKNLPGTALDYYDARAAVDDITPGAYDGLPYTSRVHAENLVRRCDPATLTDSLKQLIERKRDLDFPWFPRVWCATTSWARPRWWTWPVCVMQLPTWVATRPRSTPSYKRS